MFCKWCGQTIKTTDAACPACGRQTPALSDCGGLYNLKIEKAVTVVMPDPAEKRDALAEKDKKTVEKTRTWMLFCTAMTIIFVLALLVGSALFTWQIRQMREEIDTLKEALEEEQSDSPEDADNPDPTDPEKETDPEEETDLEEETDPEEETKPKETEPTESEETKPMEPEDTTPTEPA